MKTSVKNKLSKSVAQKKTKTREAFIELFNLFPNPYIVFNNKTGVESFSKNFLSVFKIKIKKNKPITDYIPEKFIKAALKSEGKEFLPVKALFTDININCAIKNIPGDKSTFIAVFEKPLNFSEHNNVMNAMLESVNHCVFICDDFGKILYANDSFANALKIDFSKTRELNGIKLFFSGGLFSRSKKLSGIIGEDPYSFKGRPEVDGKELDEVNVIISRIEEDKYFAVFKPSVDSAATETYKAIIEDSLQGVLIFQYERAVYTNNRIALMTGFSPDELMYLTAEEFSALIEPEDRIKLIENVQNRFINELSPSSYELKMRHKDGRLKWFEINSTIIRFNGNPAIQVAFIDITDRKRIERALRESEERYRTLVDTLPLAIIVIKAVRLAFINSSAAKILGISEPSKAIGRAIMDFVAEESKDFVVKRLKRIALGQPNPPAEIKWKREDGASIETECASLPVRYEGEQASLILAQDITDKKSAEKELKESEERLRVALEATSDGVWDFNLKSGDYYFSSAFIKTFCANKKGFQYSLESFFDIVKVEDREPVKKAFNDHLKGRSERFRVEFRINSRSPEARWALNRGKVVLRDEEGSPVRIVGTITDVTEQKNAQIELQKSKERYALAVDAGKISVWEFNFETNEFYIASSLNEGKIIKDEASDSPFSPILSFIHEEDKEMVESEIRDYLKGKKPIVEIKHRGYNLTGDFCWILTRGAATLNENGKPFKLMGTFTDITEMQKIEEALKISERDYRELFENAHDAIIIFRPEDEKVLMVNQRACQMYGFTMEEFLSISLESITKNVARGKKIIAKTLKTGSAHNYETIHYKKNGDEMHLELNASVVNYGGEMALLIINRDITERKKFEKEIIAAKEDAEAAYTAKSQFLANMSHELRTPLNGILGFAQILLADTEVRDYQRQYLDTIILSGNYLLNLINDILDYSKIEAQKMELYLQPILLSETMSNIADMIRLKAEKKGLRFVYEISENIPLFVYGDEKRLSQVALNLLSNAVKFTDHGFVMFKLYSENDKVVFEVKDSGIGISAENINDIFMPFKQLSSGGDRAEGTGLGLSISKKLVELLGGELKVESEVGAGSVFAFSLILPEASSFIDIDEFKKLEVTGFTGDRKRIFLAGSDENELLMYLKLWSLLGFEVRSGLIDEAFGKCVEFYPNLIIIDAGARANIDFLDKIKKAASLKESKTLSFIPPNEDAVLIEISQSGADSILTKPISLIKNLEEVRNLLKIEWKYLQKKYFKIEDRDNDLSLVNIIDLSSPPKKELIELYDLVQVGDIEAIEATLRKIKNQGSVYGPFVENLRELLGKFKIKEVRELLENLGVKSIERN